MEESFTFLQEIVRLRPRWPSCFLISFSPSHSQPLPTCTAPLTRPFIILLIIDIQHYIEGQNIAGCKCNYFFTFISRLSAFRNPNVRFWLMGFQHSTFRLTDWLTLTVFDTSPLRADNITTRDYGIPSLTHLVCANRKNKLLAFQKCQNRGGIFTPIEHIYKQRGWKQTKQFTLVPACAKLCRYARKEGYYRDRSTTSALTLGKRC